MRLSRILFPALFVLACLYPPQKAIADTKSLPKLLVFYSTSCHRCQEVENLVMPEIQSRYRGQIEVEYLEIGDSKNYLLLLGLQEKYGVKMKNDLPVFYFEGRFLSGAGDVKYALIGMISAGLKEGFRPGYYSADEIPAIDLVGRFRSFGIPAIIGAGLIDGINPCAFTVIVFFMSFLALQGYRKPQVAAIGLAFILSVFVTYLLTGLGLFNFLYAMKGFWRFSRVFNSVVGWSSILLGLVALYDYIIFKRSGSSEALKLQLPRPVKGMIHAVIGRHYRKKDGTPAQRADRPIARLVISALITGFLVSLLELVCTGQVYLPTITLVLKMTDLKIQAFGALLLYNAMFIAPLIVIFLFALRGTNSAQFSGFLKKHLAAVKLLMASLFFLMGWFLLFGRK